MFLQKNLSVNLVKTLMKICNNMRKVSSRLFSNSFIYCSKLVALVCPKHEYLSKPRDQLKLAEL